MQRSDVAHNDGPVLSRHLIPLVFPGEAPWNVEGLPPLFPDTLASGGRLSQKQVASIRRCAEKRLNALLYSGRSLDYGFNLARHEVIASLNRVQLEPSQRRRLDALLAAWPVGEDLSLAMIASIHGFGVTSMMRIFAAFDASEDRLEEPGMPDMKIEDAVHDARYLRDMVTRHGITADDVRLCGFLTAFVSTMQADDGQLVMAIDAYLGHENRPEIASTLLALGAARLRECERMSLDEELPDILRSALVLQGKVGHFELLARRLGVLGAAPCAVADLAREVGCSRESLYLYERSLSVLLKGRSAYRPALTRTIDLVRCLAVHGPISVEQIEMGLRAAGLTKGPFSFDGILRMAEFMSIDVTDIRGFALPTQWKAGMAVRDSNFVLRHALVGEVRDQCADTGAAHVEILQSRMSEAAGGLVNREEIESVIREAGLEWLDERQTWLWEPVFDRNRVAVILDKMLTVSGPRGLGFDDFYRGYVKTMAHTQSHGSRPLLPCRVAHALVASLPWCRLNAQRAVSRTGRASADPLSSVEKTAVVTLAREQGVMSREAFRAAMSEQGISESAIYQVVEWSPILNKRDNGEVGLCGHRNRQTAGARIAALAAGALAAVQ